MDTVGEKDTSNVSKEEETSPRGAKRPRADETFVEAGPEDKKLNVSTSDVSKTVLVEQSVVSSKTVKTAPVEQGVLKIKTDTVEEPIMAMTATIKPPSFVSNVRSY